MQSKASTVAEYLKSLPADRRDAIEAVRQVMLKNLGKGYEEGMQYGMIGYYVPHSIFPQGYHCDPSKPLNFAALASQKNAMSLYLTGLYCDCVDGGEGETAAWFKQAWAKTGKKLDMGKCCIRFKKVDDLALDVIAEALRRMPVKTYLDMYLTALGDRATPSKAAKKPSGRRATSKKHAKKTAVKKLVKKNAK
jgi:hypothetical protein